MSEIRDRDEFLLIVNRLMICAMEDIDCGRNEAGPTTLDLVRRIEDHDAALRLALETATRELEIERNMHAETRASLRASRLERDEARQERDLAKSRRRDIESARDAALARLAEVERKVVSRRGASEDPANCVDGHGGAPCDRCFAKVIRGTAPALKGAPRE